MAERLDGFPRRARLIDRFRVFAVGHSINLVENRVQGKINLFN